MQLATFTRIAMKAPLVRKVRRLVFRMTKPKPRGNYNKVFCVGWVKTGTTSFSVAMRRLGFKHCSWDVDVFREWYKKGDIERIVRYAQYFESFDDQPWNRIDLLETLDKAYPGSKFVLLERESESWFRSLQSQRSRHGFPVPTDKEATIQEYEKRNATVREYFSGERQSHLLIMDVTRGEGYEKLCSFLGIPVLNEPFPHSNQAPRYQK